MHDRLALRQHDLQVRDVARLLELLAQSASRLLNILWHHLNEKEHRVERREGLREVGRDVVDECVGLLVVRRGGAAVGQVELLLNLNVERRLVLQLIGLGPLAYGEVVSHDGVGLSPVHAPDPVDVALRHVAELAHLLGQGHVVLGHARVKQGEDLGEVVEPDAGARHLVRLVLECVPRP